MKDYVVMRCGTTRITFITFNDRGIFTDAVSFSIPQHKNNDAAWLKAFSLTLDQVPKTLREEVLLVIPPSANVFTKYIVLPDVERSKYHEALQFEFCRNFPGSPTDWIWESYKLNQKSNDTFILAMPSGFTELFFDALIRKKVKFSYLCPEILLIQSALQKYTTQKENTILAHIGGATTLFSVNNKNAQYIRIVPLASEWINEQIANSQQISLSDANKIKEEQLQKLNNDSHAASFIKYYVRQFAQKFQQELKRSELFFCRTFNQTQTTKILLSGIFSTIKDFTNIIHELNPNSEIQPITELIPQNIFSKFLDDEKRAILSRNILTYIGTSDVVIHNRTKVLNLFADTFKHQITFQRRHPSYMATMIIIIFATILGLKLTKQKFFLLKSQKLAIEAKLRESIIDTQKYNETIAAEKRIRESIIQIKNALYSQDDWLNIFDHLQQSIKGLNHAWIDSFNWNNFQQNEENNIIHTVVKIFINDNTDQSTYSRKIQSFIESVKNCSLIQNVNNIIISEIENSVLSFSFDIELNTNSKIFVK